MEFPDPFEAIKFEIDRTGIVKTLEPAVGKINRFNRISRANGLFD